MRFTQSQSPILFVALLLAGTAWSNMARVAHLEGSATIFSGTKERAARVQAPLKSGDKIVTGAETLLEIQYAKGTVVRIGENAELIISGDGGSGHVQIIKGKVWANVQKMAAGGFRVTTPVATAAVRGTVFRVETDPADSSSTVALYDGKVDVGPADTTAIKPAAAPAAAWGPPVEVPGPYEVSLETWIQLDPGKQIHVRWGGAYSTSDIPAPGTDQWIAWNQARDRALKRVGH